MRFVVGFLLPGENLGELRSRIVLRFWPPRFLLLCEIRDRIPARVWPSGFLLPGENLGEIRSTILARFWPPGISLPGEIPAGKKNPGGQKSRRDPGGIPAKIAAGSRQDPGPYFTREAYSL